MAAISVFDMLKVGVGPSSSHTMGPWRAAQRFMRQHLPAERLHHVRTVTAHLYGSLAKTGRGHGTDIAVMLGLGGHEPTTFDTTTLNDCISVIRAEKMLALCGSTPIPFDPAQAIVFHFSENLPYHPNGLRFVAEFDDGAAPADETYYSVGGGFVVQEGERNPADEIRLPYPCQQAEDVLAHCAADGHLLWQMVWENELTWRTPEQIEADLDHLWDTMADCVYRGCHTVGILPGGLGVTRRASAIHHRLLAGAPYADRDSWIERIREARADFTEVIKWVSVFALAVNEENAAFGRVVTAPTNGAAGVIPAVLMYYVCFHRADRAAVRRFLLAAGEIGSLFKKGATISAAMGGCQAEIGVSSAMAAAALAEGLGASVEQSLMAAEIAMEHHLGLTCDPIGGLVQIPCIERNTMGAIKAITAANLALEGTPHLAKVSLDGVIRTMWQTAQDMNEKYKETSEGGLAVNIPVNVAEC